MSGIYGPQGLGQQQATDLGRQSYYVSKSVEVQIAEADPKKLVQWYELTRERVHDLHESSKEAYAQVYPGGAK